MKFLQLIYRRFALPFILCLICIADLSGQIYKGGEGTGYTDGRFLGTLEGISTSTLYQAGIEDGFGQEAIKSSLNGLKASAPFGGGFGDGYADDRVLLNLSGQDLTVMFRGGLNDGYAQDWSLSTLQSVAFPVEILSFDARLKKDAVLLEWVSGFELNHAAYLIERSSDATSFEVIGEIGSQGNSQDKRAYEYYDRSPLVGHSYYRLKSVDLDGSLQYSHIEEIWIDLGSEALIYPNPNSDHQVNIRWEALAPNQALQIEVYNLQGHLLIQEERVQLSAGFIHQFQLPESLPAASYLIRLSQGNLLSKHILILN
ncbi:MAG: T9SS type A sorting domain-containing protein [Bacteroidia bacterium]|nr:T9SS type A sorting domain-containing protein [Bacteroidia bacterium]